VCVRACAEVNEYEAESSGAVCQRKLTEQQAQEPTRQRPALSVSLRSLRI